MEEFFIIIIFFLAFNSFFGEGFFLTLDFHLGRENGNRRERGIARSGEGLQSIERWQISGQARDER